MRTQRFHRFMTLVPLVLLSAALAAGASSPDIIARVPFAFIVAEQELPSGEYSVARVTDQFVTPLVVRSENGETSVMVRSHPMVREMTRDAVPKLVFHRYGERFFLAEVWSGGTAGFDLPASEEEREYIDSEIRYASVVILGRSGR